MRATNGRDKKSQHIKMEESEGRKEGWEGGEEREGREKGKEEGENKRNSRVVVNTRNIQHTRNQSLRKENQNNEIE